MEDVINTINNKYFVALGTISSIASLALTILVYIGVNRIKKFYIFTARMPAIKERLQQIASDISAHPNIFEGYSTKTFTILADAEIALRSLRNKTDGPLQIQAAALIKQVQRIGGKQSLIR